MHHHDVTFAGDGMDIEDDSPWIEDGQDHTQFTGKSDERVAQQEWDKLALRYSDAGYRDGITAGKLARLQTGFDQGFALAVPHARQVGVLRGVAASVLALLTTTSAGKHAGIIRDRLQQQEQQQEQGEGVVEELRAVVNELGKLDEGKVVPVDQEAIDHAKEHDKDQDGAGPSQAMLDRADMDEMSRLLEGVPIGKTESAGAARGQDVDGPARVEGLRIRLERVLEKCGLEDVLPPRRG